MKAVVVYQIGEMPQYSDFPELVIQNSDEL